MSGANFTIESLGRFQAAYPQQPTLLGHKLAGHPLLEIDALAALTERLPAHEVEYNAADLPIGITERAPPNGLSAAETLRTIEENGSWMVLKRVERDPAYGALLRAVLAEIRDIVRPATGEMLQLEAFIFVSSPNAMTPLHYDPEYNILLQLKGEKVMTVFPADDAEIKTPEFEEEYHSGGFRNLPWREEFAARGEAFPIRAGKAIYVPVGAPHWVKNGPASSISFSVTWRSRWSFHEADAHAFNRRLRRLGITPAAPRRFPESNLLKSVAHRSLAKASRVLRR
jgi:hypothetical protein